MLRAIQRQWRCELGSSDFQTYVLLWSNLTPSLFSFWKWCPISSLNIAFCWSMPQIKLQTTYLIPKWYMYLLEFHSLTLREECGFFMHISISRQKKASLIVMGFLPFKILLYIVIIYHFRTYFFLLFWEERNFLMLALMAFKFYNGAWLIHCWTCPGIQKWFAQDFRNRHFLQKKNKKRM